MIIKQIKDFFRSKTVIITIAVFYSLTHMQFLTYSQYWDSNLYWHGLLGAVDSLSRTPFSLHAYATVLLANFNILHQLTMGYISLMALSQLFGIGNIVALNTENMILAILAIWAFYNIVTFFFPKHKVENILITLIFAFNPLFYATSISFNTDYSLLIFTVLMVEAFINKRTFLFILWSLMLTLSKITGSFIYFSFVFFYYAYFAFKKSVILKWKNTLIQTVIFGLPILAFTLYTLYARGHLWSSYDEMKFNLTWSSNCNFCFGINQENIKARLFQIFILNFSWITSLIVIVSIFKNYIKHTSIFGKLSKEQSNFLIVIMFVFLSFVFFNLSVVVMNFSRYVVAGVFLSILLFYVSASSLLKGSARVFTLLIIFLLVFIQTFKAIDPSPYLFYGISYLGRNISSPIFGHNDAMVYNTQFFFIDGLNKLIIDNTSKGTKSIYDFDTGYFFKDPNFIGSIDNLPSIYKAGNKNLTYIYLPWLGYRNKLYDYVNILYTIKDIKILDYHGYYVEMFYIEAINK